MAIQINFICHSSPILLQLFTLSSIPAHSFGSSPTSLHLWQTSTAFLRDSRLRKLEIFNCNSAGRLSLMWSKGILILLSTTLPSASLFILLSSALCFASLPCLHLTFSLYHSVEDFRFQQMNVISAKYWRLNVSFYQLLNKITFQYSQICPVHLEII